MSNVYSDFQPLGRSKTEEVPMLSGEAQRDILARMVERCQLDGITSATVADWTLTEFEQCGLDIALEGHEIDLLDRGMLDRLVALLLQCEVEERDEQAWEDGQEYSGNRCPGRE